MIEHKETWVIYVDNYITRRKLFHLVADKSLKLRFRSRLLADCIKWLAAEGVTEYELRWPEQEGLRCTVATSYKKD